MTKTTCFYCGDSINGEGHKKTCLTWKEDIKKAKEKKQTLAIVVADLESRLDSIERWDLPRTISRIKNNTDHWVELQKERISILEALEKLK